MCYNVLASSLVVRLGMNCTVTNLMSLDKVNEDLTHQHHTHCQHHELMSLDNFFGMLMYAGSTIFGLLLTDFPRTHGNEGPKMALALALSFNVVGQSQNRERGLF
jgi:hypothetical protein